MKSHTAKLRATHQQNTGGLGLGRARKASPKRVIFIQVFIAAWILVIGAKLIYLQVGDHDRLRARAERQHQAEIELSPTRGVIYDRNGNELARSVEVKSLYASPAEIKDAAVTADRLSALLDVDREALYRRLTSDAVLVAVKRKLNDQEVARVQSLSLPGLRFLEEMKRFYVSGQAAAHVLGFVDIDERGMGGIELAYDKQVRGQGGRLVMDVDALNKSYDHSLEKSVPGADVQLTIDILIQHYAEKALADGIRRTGARAGTVVVVRPATGEILALANYPTFDPNKVGESKDAARRNYAVETSFEPGSIFKLVTYSAALEEGLIRPDTLIDCGGGQIKIADRIVHDHPYGTLTASQALAKSSNVAAIKLGMRLGNERFARYIHAFGFGQRTGIELPAEARGLLADVSRWGPTTIGSIPMGHEVGVTAVQGVAAFATIANGGVYIAPHLVSRVTSSSGDLLEQHKSEPRRVVSEDTASDLKAMLEGVVVKGTGKRAQISGYRAAGKTGTAQKVDEVTKRYSNTRYVASFAGFAPVNNPEVACLVSLDEPRGAYHGGDAAAPVFAQVVADTLQILGVPPEDDPGSGLKAADFHVFDIPRAVVAGGSPSSEEEADSRPALDVTATNESKDASKRYGSVVVPDLMGKGIREAVALCAKRGLILKASGEGVVAGQTPSPGALVSEDTVCVVRLSKQVLRKREKEEVAQVEARPARAEKREKQKPQPAKGAPAKGATRPRLKLAKGTTARTN
ncbi:MAG TPA: penicillin-binding protein [Blastocatellia bacterium]|nr:penicillin-binding protein [Blastocatellia bacterium]